MIFLLFPLQKSNGQTNSSREDLEKLKLQKEIELLDKQIEKESNIFYLLLQ